MPKFEVEFVTRGADKVNAEVQSMLSSFDKVGAAMQRHNTNLGQISGGLQAGFGMIPGARSFATGLFAGGVAEFERAASVSGGVASGSVDKIMEPYLKAREAFSGGIASSIDTAGGIAGHLGLSFANAGTIGGSLLGGALGAFAGPAGAAAGAYAGGAIGSALGGFLDDNVTASGAKSIARDIFGNDKVLGPGDAATNPSQAYDLRRQFNRFEDSPANRLLGRFSANPSAYTQANEVAARANLPWLGGWIGSDHPGLNGRIPRTLDKAFPNPAESWHLARKRLADYANRVERLFGLTDKAVSYDAWEAMELMDGIDDPRTRHYVPESHLMRLGKTNPNAAVYSIIAQGVSKMAGSRKTFRKPAETAF